MRPEIRLLKDIVDNTPLPIAVYTGEDLTIALANPAMAAAWGKDGTLVGKKYLEVLPEVRDDVFFEQALSVLKTGTAVHGKDKKTDLVVNGTLQCFYFNYSFIPLFDAEGSVYAVMNTGVDVTELHLASQQVQRAEERLRMAIDSSGIGTFERNLSSGQLLTSGAFKEIYGVERIESDAQLLARLHPDDLAVHEQAIAASRLTGKIFYEARLGAAGQAPKWVRVAGKVLSDALGAPVTVIGTVQDISEHRRFQEELLLQVAERTSQLKRSNDDLLHFAGVVSHDLREPVRKIKIFSGMLRGAAAPHDERSERYMAKIVQSADRMDGIIEGILAYSTVDSDMQPVERISLDQAIESIKTDLELLIKDKGAVLIADPLPEIEGAPILVSQLFYNLIQNALKFSKADEPPKVTISCSLVEAQGVPSVQVRIKDNGIGLDAQQAEKIFVAFERLHSKDDYEGNGLGLALCRKIAQRHRGTITASGEKGAWTAMTVTLPLRQPSATL